MKGKKGAIEGLQSLIVPLIGIGIVLAVGFLIIAEAQDQLKTIQGLTSAGNSVTHPNGTSAWNATEDIQNAISDIPGWLPIIVITVIGAILLGLVTMFRARR